MFSRGSPQEAIGLKPRAFNAEGHTDREVRRGVSGLS